MIKSGWIDNFQTEFTVRVYIFTTKNGWIYSDFTQNGTNVIKSWLKSIKNWDHWYPFFIWYCLENFFSVLSRFGKTKIYCAVLFLFLIWFWKKTDIRNSIELKINTKRPICPSLVSFWNLDFKTYCWDLGPLHTTHVFGCLYLFVFSCFPIIFSLLTLFGKKIYNQAKQWKMMLKRKNPKICKKKLWWILGLRKIIENIFWCVSVRGQSYKNLFTIGQIYKLSLSSIPCFD